jgi:hypothetical protein
MSSKNWPQNSLSQMAATDDYSEIKPYNIPSLSANFNGEPLSCFPQISRVGILVK